MKWLLALILLFVVMGCSSVKPWEKGTLAKETMRFDRPHKQLDHIYFSKEGTHLGGNQGAGGCGCN